jgi:hypothetical protein
MGDPWQLLPWVLFIAMAAVVLYHHRQRQHRTAAIFRTLAARHGGRATSGSLLAWPSLEIRPAGRTVHLFPASGGKHRPDQTHVETSTGLPREARIILQPKGVMGKLSRSLVMADIRTGDRRFEDAFIVQGEPPDRARDLLTPDVRERLLRLWDLGLNLRLEGGNLALSIDRIPAEIGPFQALIDAAVTLGGSPATTPQRSWHPEPSGRHADRRPPTGRPTGALWLVRTAVVGALSVVIVTLAWISSQAPPASPTSQAAGDRTVGDLSDHSYSGHRGRTLGPSGDGIEVRLDDFAGGFLWVDMEGPWCSTSATQAADIRSLVGSRTDVEFLTLVTSGQKPLTVPTRATAQTWARRHGLRPSHVVAYDSTVAVPHHILYSPSGQTLLRHTGHLPAAQLRARLDAEIQGWKAWAGAD